MSLGAIGPRACGWRISRPWSRSPYTIRIFFRHRSEHRIRRFDSCRRLFHSRTQKSRLIRSNKDTRRHPCRTCISPHHSCCKCRSGSSHETACHTLCNCIASQRALRLVLPHTSCKRTRPSRGPGNGACRTACICIPPSRGLGRGSPRTVCTCSRPSRGTGRGSPHTVCTCIRTMRGSIADECVSQGLQVDKRPVRRQQNIQPQEVTVPT